METKFYLISAGVVILLICLVGGPMWSNRQIATLEGKIADAEADTDASEKKATAREIEAAEYKQKILYLDTKLNEIEAIARKQDEQLEKLTLNSRDARSDVERARRTRAVTATAAELCSKLAELGHACQ